MSFGTTLAPAGNNASTPGFPGSIGDSTFVPGPSLGADALIWFDLIRLDLDWPWFFRSSNGQGTNRRKTNPAADSVARPVSSLDTSLYTRDCDIAKSMLNNAPSKTIRHGDLTVEGYSRAAVQSYWRIPELKLGFDLGAHPWDFMGTPTWLISHTHLDHIAALPLYVARRRLMKMNKPRVFVPAHAVEAVQQMLKSFERLDRGRLPCELIGVEARKEYDLSRELVVKAYRTRHTVPSFGFIVFERRRKLKPEYLELSGEQIKALRESGTQITEEKRVPLVGYTGDTSPEGLDDNPEFYQCKILITEMTFVAPDHRKHLIHKNGHMHLDDFVERQRRFENELIIAGHFSTRYNRHQAEKIVGRAIPGLLDGRLKVWV